ncbi:MAG: hypothetical protein WA373_04540 [Burkholderiales bacterium]
MKQPRTYLVLVAVFVLSTALGLFLPVTDIFRGIAATPGIAALIGILWHAVKEQTAFERAQQLQRQQQLFSLGTTSHMANVAFDKHVEFCKKYMQEVDKTVDTLYRRGPTEQAMAHANTLYSLRRDYAAWLTKDISEALEPFEKIVRMIGSLTLTAGGLPDGHEFKTGAMGRTWDLLQKVLIPHRENPAPGDANATNEAVKEQIRSILGIEQLTKIRTKLIDRALLALEE